MTSLKYEENGDCGGGGGGVFWSSALVESEGVDDEKKWRKLGFAIGRRLGLSWRDMAVAAMGEVWSEVCGNPRGLFSERR